MAKRTSEKEDGGMYVHRFWSWGLVCLMAACLGCDDGCDGGSAPAKCTTNADCAGVATGACEFAVCAENKCVIVDREDNAPCDDGNAGTGDDKCNGGLCVGTACTCTTTSICCDGCLPHTDGKACTEDDIDCTDDVCFGGICAHPVREDWCMIGGLCYSNGTANPANDCQYCNSPVLDTEWRSREDNTPCNDSACTENDVCAAGQCKPGAPVVCPPAADTCHEQGSCDPATGDCSDPPANSGKPCDDGDPETQNDVCDGAGNCGGCTCNTSDPATCCDGCLGIPGGTCDGSLSCAPILCTDDGKCVPEQAEDTCLIDGECYEPDDEKPNDPCNVCKPEKNATGWTTPTGLEEKPCDDEDNDCDGYIDENNTWPPEDQYEENDQEGQAKDLGPIVWNEAESISANFHTAYDVDNYTWTWVPSYTQSYAHASCTVSGLKAGQKLELKIEVVIAGVNVFASEEGIVGNSTIKTGGDGFDAIANWAFKLVVTVSPFSGINECGNTYELSCVMEN